jgi:hypothetical protein
MLKNQRMLDINRIRLVAPTGAGGMFELRYDQGSKKVPNIITMTISNDEDYKLIQKHLIPLGVDAQ